MRAAYNNNDKYFKRLQIDVEEGWLVINIIEREMDTHQQIHVELLNLISQYFGNKAWQMLVHARWLKKRQ